jgi:hypothetical protein
VRLILGVIAAGVVGWMFSGLLSMGLGGVIAWLLIMALCLPSAERA